MDEMEFNIQGEGKYNIQNLFGGKPGGWRQCSTDHWEVIDGMDQVKPRFLEKLPGKKDQKKKQYDEQHYNVYVYKVLPCPPGSKEKQNLLITFADLLG